MNAHASPGETADAFLDRRVTFALGGGKLAKDWTNQTMTLRKLWGRLRRHVAGKKDGPAITQGELLGTRREAEQVKAQHILMVDVDTGLPLDEIAELIRQRGLFAFLWHTHSNGTMYTRVSDKTLRRFRPGLSEVLVRRVSDSDPGLIALPEVCQALEAYLRERKKYDERVIESVWDTTWDAEKREWTLWHVPMEKVRVMFPLDRPFPVAEHGAAGIENWRVKYVDVCQMLGIPFDASCTDPNRLMFLPRRPKDGAAECWRTLMIPGKALDLDTVPHVPEPRKSTSQRAQEASHGAPGSREDQCKGFKTPGLRDFLREHGHFEAAAWIKAVTPNDVRKDYGEREGKGIDARCPFESGHTHQDERDRAFAVRDASKGRGHGFWMNCLHEGCKEETNDDRGMYLDELCQDYEVKHADELLKWCPGYEAKSDDEKTKPRVLIKTATEMTIEGVLEYEHDPLVGRIFFRKGEQATLHAETTAGKTFLGIDLGFHLALPNLTRWFGDEDDPDASLSVAHCPVLYVPFEDVPGFEKRVVAAKKEFGDPGPWFVRFVPDITLNSSDAGAEGVKLIIEAAKDQARRCGVPTGLIIIDTKIRATAGDNDDKTQDAGRYVEQRIGKIIKATGATVLTLSHPNRAGDERGSLVPRQADDVRLTVIRKGGKRTLYVEKVRNGESDFAAFDYSLKMHELGVNGKGRPVTSCTPVKDAPSLGRGGKSQQEKGLKRGQRVIDDAFDSLRTDPEVTTPGFLPVARVRGQRANADAVRAVFLKMYNREAYGKEVQDEAIRQAWKRTLEELPPGFELTEDRLTLWQADKEPLDGTTDTSAMLPRP
jgi:AAA domain